MEKFNRKLGKVLILMLAIFLLYVSIGTIEVWRFGQVDETRRADVAIVLGASVWGNQPSPVFAERINHGIWLYQNNYVEYLIFTGGVSEGNQFSEAFIAKEYAHQQGVPLEAIFIEEKSANTRENINYAIEIVMAENMETILLVSDPLHMRRSLQIARDRGLQVYSSPTKTTRYTSLQTQIPFLMRESFWFTAQRLFGWMI
ncbi:MAG: YdcF family protein [Lachnospiraceae bacterium]|nr:YdcF family protein [Lachnospiraceae bacterium]